MKSTKGGWGLGAWGGRSNRVDGCGDGYGVGIGAGAGVKGLRAGESLGDLIQRERAVARRLAKAEAKADAAARG